VTSGRIDGMSVKEVVAVEMLDRLKALRAWLVIGATGIVSASCSGNSNSSGFDTSPATLISHCDQICNNILATCPTVAGVPYNACTSACNDLAVLPQSCVNPFASYLLCLAGATSVSVTCGANGEAAIVTPADCESDREATLNCNAAPGPVSACLALPGNVSCAAPPPGSGSNVEFCVGAPVNCAPPSPNPLGIGLYCCP
jgi:hypothetical protein